MSLSPEEIENKNFVVALRGYDKAQVDRFLQTVASEYREALRVHERPSEPAGEGPGDPFGQLGEQVAVIARSAADGANEILNDAERSRSELLQAASQEAERLREQARQELVAAQTQRDDVLREVAELRELAQKDASHIRADAEEHATHARRLKELARQELEAVRAQREDALREVAELRESAQQKATRVKAALDEQVAHARRLEEQARQELEGVHAQREDSIREVAELRQWAEQEASRVRAGAEEQAAHARRLGERAKADAEEAVRVLQAAWAEVEAAEQLRIAAEEEAHETLAHAVQEAKEHLPSGQHDVKPQEVTSRASGDQRRQRWRG